MTVGVGVASQRERAKQSRREAIFEAALGGEEERTRAQGLLKLLGRPSRGPTDP